MTLLAYETKSDTNPFKAERVSRTASFIIRSSIENVFPLFGPVREMEWAQGWTPQLIYSETKEVEEHMIFETNGKFEGEEKYTWIITKYFPQDYLIEYNVSTPERIWFITVKCEALGKETKTTVTYTYTGLTERGNERNKEALANMYSDNLKDWEEAINHYITTGKSLSN